MTKPSTDSVQPPSIADISRHALFYAANNMKASARHHNHSFLLVNPVPIDYSSDSTAAAPIPEALSAGSPTLPTVVEDRATTDSSLPPQVARSSVPSVTITFDPDGATATGSTAAASVAGTGAEGAPLRPVRRLVESEMHIQVSKGVDGLFLKRADVDELGLDYLEDDVETCYGPLRRLSPVILLTTHHLTPVLHYFLVNNVYEMPAGFENSEVYGGGVVSLSLVLSLGVSVAFDRGTVYLVDPQAGSDLVGWDVVGSRAEVTVAPPKGGAFNSGGKEDGDAAEATGTLLVRSEIEEFDDGDEDDEY